MFNVLYEPWMGVVDMNGNEALVGLRDYLVNAHLYKCSAENKQFAVLRRLQQRLAETFVMDIFGINIDTEAALINAGLLMQTRLMRISGIVRIQVFHLTYLMKTGHSCRQTK